VVLTVSMPAHAQGAVPLLAHPLDGDRTLGGAVPGYGQVHDVTRDEVGDGASTHDSSVAALLRAAATPLR